MAVNSPLLKRIKLSSNAILLLHPGYTSFIPSTGLASRSVTRVTQVAQDQTDLSAPSTCYGRYLACLDIRLIFTCFTKRSAVCLWPQRLKIISRFVEGAKVGVSARLSGRRSENLGLTKPEPSSVSFRHCIIMGVWTERTGKVLKIRSSRYGPSTDLLSTPSRRPTISKFFFRHFSGAIAFNPYQTPFERLR
jgi:hypothetical protein